MASCLTYSKWVRHRSWVFTKQWFDWDKKYLFFHPLPLGGKSFAICQFFLYISKYLFGLLLLSPNKN